MSTTTMVIDLHPISALYTFTSPCTAVNTVTHKDFTAAAGHSSASSFHIVCDLLKFQSELNENQDTATFSHLHNLRTNKSDTAVPWVCMFSDLFYCVLATQHRNSGGGTCHRKLNNNAAQWEFINLASVSSPCVSRSATPTQLQNICTSIRPTVHNANLHLSAHIKQKLWSKAESAHIDHVN